jgi:hypothetical protein
MERANSPRKVLRSARQDPKTLPRVAARLINDCADISDLRTLQNEFERAIEHCGFRYFACGAHVDPLNSHSRRNVVELPRPVGRDICMPAR